MASRTSKHKPRPRTKAAPKRAPAQKAKPAPAARRKQKAPAAVAAAGKPGRAARPAPALAPDKGAAAAVAQPAKLVALKPAKPPKKSGRRSPLLQRRGPDGQILAPGELLLPGGTQTHEEAHYLFRGVIATQKANADTAINEIVAKKQPDNPLAQRSELERQHGALWMRFHKGSIEPGLPNRGQPKKTFQAVIERAKQRRREIGAFLRGLDVGRPDSSQIDSHGEASLQGLMEWSARLEKLTDADEPAQGDYEKFHDGLDKLDHHTESLIVDLEQTLRRMGGGRQK